VATNGAVQCQLLQRQLPPIRLPAGIQPFFCWRALLLIKLEGHVPAEQKGNGLVGHHARKVYLDVVVWITLAHPERLWRVAVIRLPSALESQLPLQLVDGHGVSQMLCNNVHACPYCHITGPYSTLRGIATACQPIATAITQSSCMPSGAP